MTDEALAPAPAEPTAAPQEAPQEAQKEAKPTDEAPQAVEKPRSRREALERALESVDGKEEAPKGTREAVDLKPQEAPKNEDPAPKAEAKAKDGPEGPQRAPDGKFAPKDEGKRTEPAKAATDVPKGKADFTEPPARFSPDAKAEWGKAPDSIKAEAHRAVREMEKGLADYKAQVEPLAPYAEMAKQAGKDLPAVVKEFVDMEAMLRQNPIQGFSEIARRIGATPQQIGQLLLGQQPGQADPRDQEIARLRQQVATIEQQVGQHGQAFQEQRQASVQSQIEAFAAQHDRFDELASEIARMLDTGYASDLEDAYRKAELMHPAPNPAPAFEPVPPSRPAQTRPALSVTGAPTAGSNPGKRTPSSSRREALERAVRAAGL